MPNQGKERAKRNNVFFQLSLERTIEQKYKNSPTPIMILGTLFFNAFERFIIKRVTNGNSTHGNCVAIEKIHGKIPIKRISTPNTATMNNTAG